MPLEDQLAALTEVVKQGFEQIAALLKQTDNVVQMPVQSNPKTNGEAKEREPTFEEVTAIAQELARVKGPTFAGKLIQQHGGGRLAQMPKDKYASFIVAAEVMLREASL
jgi:hypothetical protein